MRLSVLKLVPLLALSACDRQATGPVAPLDEVDIATSVSAQAQAAMGGPGGAPTSILRNLVQEIRNGDNERAKAQLDRAMAQSRAAAAAKDQEMAKQAHAMVIQVVAGVFPNASVRISGVTKTGLERARNALGRRDAPRINNILDQVGGLLRQSNSAHEAGREAGALEFAIQAAEMLGKLVDHVRAGRVG
jgi:hypothetical protein